MKRPPGIRRPAQTPAAAVAAQQQQRRTTRIAATTGTGNGSKTESVLTVGVTHRRTAVATRTAAGPPNVQRRSRLRAAATAPEIVTGQAMQLTRTGRGGSVSVDGVREAETSGPVGRRSEGLGLVAVAGSRAAGTGHLGTPKPGTELKLTSGLRQSRPGPANEPAGGSVRSHGMLVVVVPLTGIGIGMGRGTIEAGPGSRMPGRGRGAAADEAGKGGRL